jgi:predicted secreted Zn-dependent protease
MIVSDVKQLFSISTPVTTKGVSALHFLISSFLLTTVVALFSIALHTQPIATATPIQTTSPVIVTKTITPEPASAATAPAATRSAPIQVVENCTPTEASPAPSALNLLNLPDGLTNITEAPALYKIFGNTATQIRSQIRACAPHSDTGEVFAGETSYTLTWQYVALTADNGLCTISHLKIGLHVSMSLPAWSPSAQTTNGLASQWQNFIRSLTTHENGHVSLNTQYAGQLLNDLQNTPAVDCGTLNATVQTKARTALANLDAANVTLDSQTDHGATQGAILP